MDRRGFLATAGGVVATSVAGCADVGRSGDDASGEPIPEEDLEFQVNSPEHLFMRGIADQDGYAGEFEDRSGNDTVQVDLYATDAARPPADPPAIVVDTGTTVEFVWADDAAEHRLVIYEAGSEEPDEAMGNDGMDADEGFTFTYTFTEPGLNRVANSAPGNDTSIAVYVTD